MKHRQARLDHWGTGSLAAVLSAALMTVATPVQAGDVLFVSDTLTDAMNIPSVLSGGSAEVAHPVIAGAMFRPAMTADDHDVTIIRNDYVVTGGVVFAAEGTNPALAAGVTLGDYCSVYWSGSGPHEPDTLGGGLGADGGLHTDAAVFASLDAYVGNGGYVFVTGHDAVTDPIDPLMEDFVGGALAVAAEVVRVIPNSAPFGATSNTVDNALTTGEVDIRLMTPGSVVPGGVNTLGGAQDLDYIGGADAAEVTGVADEPQAAGAFMWTERIPAANGGSAMAADFSVGRIAYVANGTFLFEDLPFNPGTFLSDGEDASWLADPDYNGALRNFAFNACNEAAPPPDAPTNLAGRVKRTSVSLTWTASAGADNYRVFRRLDTEVDFSEVGQTTGTVFATVLPGGAASAEYYVAAENANGLSDPSNIVTLMPQSR